MLRTYAAHEPRAVFVLAHGAGAGSRHPWMVRFAKGLAARGVTTLTFDFDYVANGKKVPDKPEVLEARWLAALQEARKKFPKTKIAIGGKSMGGRIASQIAARKTVDVSCVVFFGYPLHPPGKPDNRRDAHLSSIRAPMLFVQGARDTFGGEDEIVPLARSLRASVHVVPLGDHSLVVPKRSPVAQEDVYAEALDAAAAFIIAHSKTKPTPMPAPKN